MTHIPRSLRARARAARQKTPEPEQKPEGYRHSQTDGWASTERVSRRYEHGEHSNFHDMPIVFGFQPNPVSARLSAAPKENGDPR